MTEMTPILNSVHTFNDSLHRRSVPISVVTSIECDSSEQGDMTEMIAIVNNVHTSNYSLQTRRVPLSVVTRIASVLYAQVHMTVMNPI
jgi:hypothetical protein